MRVLGLMSGTSSDGIDVADVEVVREAGRPRITVRHFTSTPFVPEMRARLLAAIPPTNVGAIRVAELDVAMGRAFAEAVKNAADRWRIDLSDIDLIASHGHTAYHAPEDGVSVQIGAPAIIAQRTGVTCVADFRVADLAAGGQGAPLVPYLDRVLFADPTEYRVALNIGGIANVTMLPDAAAGGVDAMYACDTGPGNMVIDACAQRASDGAQLFDRDGAIAARGSIDAAMLDELLDDPFFVKPAPKSTGRERYGAAYAADAWSRGERRGLRSEDIVATVTALTARTIAAHIPTACKRIIAAGGGVHNRTLMRLLGDDLARRATVAGLDISDAHGVPADAKEAVAFALLACETIAGIANNVPGCTGARAAVVLGAVTPGANYRRLMTQVWGQTQA